MKNQFFIIDDTDFTINDITYFVDSEPKVKLSDAIKEKIRRSRKTIEDIVKSGKIVYGVNTGFGKFADIRIKPEQTKELQKRLVLSHAAGVGEAFNDDIVRLMMLLKVKNLSQGYSGVRLELIQLLIDMLNSNIIPVVPSKGSVGASGDLAPLAHMALPLIGDGEVVVNENGNRIPMSSKAAFAKFGLKPIQLLEKEGLAILNGTQAIQACGTLALLKAENLLKSADIIGAATLEGLLGTLTAFDERIQQIRRHSGQLKVARNFNKILENSPIVTSHKESDHRVQDAYCLRCIPQVHGAVRDAIEHIKKIYEQEINGVTDNPLIFSDENDVISGGNFHGAPVALTADYLAIVLSELGSISERRIEHMMDPAMNETEGFLVSEGGLNSGFMIAQVTAAALVSENKVLSHPASVDSIPTSANKEDHVSMGTHAARKALEVVTNCEYILAIELLCAMQSLDLRFPIIPSEATKALLNEVREKVAFLKEDRLMKTDIEIAVEKIRNRRVVQVVEDICGILN